MSKIEDIQIDLVFAEDDLADRRIDFERAKKRVAELREQLAWAESGFEKGQVVMVYVGPWSDDAPHKLESPKGVGEAWIRPIHDGVLQDYVDAVNIRNIRPATPEEIEALGVIK